jgi:hypothetical protein
MLENLAAVAPVISSFTSSCWRAASHSCGVTIGGVFIVVIP